MLSRYEELHLISYCKSINADNIKHELLPIYYYNKYFTMKIIHKEKYIEAVDVAPYKSFPSEINFTIFWLLGIFT